MSAQHQQLPAAVLGKRTGLPHFRFGFRVKPLGSVNDNGAEVGDVGERRAGREQIADAVEKPRGIVVGEKGGGIEAGSAGPRQSRVVDKGAGGVVRPAAAAVGSVGIGGQRGNSLGAVEMDGERQRIFLVRAAAAAALAA